MIWLYLLHQPSQGKPIRAVRQAVQFPVKK
jgi:hypothetical protein